MNRETTMAFPKPGRALKALLITLGVSGVATALLVNWAGAKSVFFALDMSADKVLDGQVWRLLTAGLLTLPDSFSPLFFTLIGLYFLSPDLERRWGPSRFLRFVATSIVFGYALAVAVHLVAGGHAAMFRAEGLFGASAALTAISTAWALENADAQVRLFFVLPVSGRQFLWITLAYCVLGLIYPSMYPEGVVAPFGGLITGLLFGGSPSALRSLYLRAKLGWLRRRGANEPLRRIAASAAGKGARRDGPPLRVVTGGLEDELKKRSPPKDKRFLN